jgi:hypothetical protein
LFVGILEKLRELPGTPAGILRNGDFPTGSERLELGK